MLRAFQQSRRSLLMNFLIGFLLNLGMLLPKKPFKEEHNENV